MMKGIFLFSLLSGAAHADDFSSRLGSIGVFREKANGLLRQAGVLNSDGAVNNGADRTSGTFLKIYDLSQNSLIAEGALLFGKSSFRLLVGSEPSPVQVKLDASDRFSWTDDLILSGTATQNGGRIFVEFTRLTLRSGKAISIHAVALDPAGALGLKGHKENSKLLELAGGTALGLLTSPDEAPDILGFGSVVRKSAKDRMRESLLGETKNYLKEELRESPVLRLDMDSPITVLVKEEVRL